MLVGSIRANDKDCWMIWISLLSAICLEVFLYKTDVHKIQIIFSPYLADELPPLVHADVEARLSSLDPHSAPKCVRLHNEFS